MPSDTQTDFTVKFGKIARTIDYEDSTGHILFTLDVGSKVDLKNLTSPVKNLCLEYHAPRTLRSLNYGVDARRYDIAFERVKRHLESLGYEIEICGK